MINRILIRIKVLQVLYSYVVSKDVKTLRKAKNELLESFDKSYELYNALMKMIIDLTDIEDIKLDDAKNKFLPTEEDLNPNMRFVDNQLVAYLRENENLQEFIEDKNITWRDEDIFMRLLLDKICHSEEYKKYMAMPSTDFAQDCEFWYNILRNVVLSDEDLLEQVENKSVFWTADDLDIMGQFVLKTIRRIEEGVENPILPQFKDEEDKQFGEMLFAKTVEELDENNSYIDQFVKTEKWDAERLALMDRLVMCAALTEMRHFETIPVNVSLNEYIELAKDYSTPRSGQFVNGILNAAVKDMKAKGLIIK